MRLFVALALRDAVAGALIAAQRELKQVLPSGCVNWTGPEALHLTLCFLGEVPEEKLDELKAALAGAMSRHGALELTCEGLGCFPNLRFPRILWVGVHETRGATTSGSSGSPDDSSVANPAGANAPDPAGPPQLRSDALGRLQVAVSAACDPFAEKPNTGNFTGHVTLGRFRRLGRKVAEQVAGVIESQAGRQFVCWTADQVVLFRSELRPGAARHVPLERFQVGPA